ncbi:HxlR family transcriptional regulator [Microbacterium sp. SZ1]|uniref:winged helix-turn-helix transcriptional regulator n=1 Tax=Microbacterium sp. SZ1 TaxID=1849736 RepID=UPI000BBB9151|nr:helix-turn-helix domain-containing protein [Microbacterium sp. SZ1]PCE15057.1 HxlR family transcriptional regulator [Microbacterium sp. SZ1]
MAARSYGQYCGVTTAVELIGERWALLIVRDLLVGPRRYTDLKQGLPRIPTNILSSRLTELQDGGVVRRIPLRRGLAYELTPYGQALESVILELGRWGFQTMGDPREGDVVTPDSLTMALRTAFRADAADDAEYELHVGEVALRASVREGDLVVAQISPPAPPGPPADGRQPEGEPDAVIVAGPGIRRLIGGEITPDEAIAQDVLAVVRGDVSHLESFARTFHIAPLGAPVAMR